MIKIHLKDSTNRLWLNPDLLRLNDPLDMEVRQMAFHYRDLIIREDGPALLARAREAYREHLAREERERLVREATLCPLCEVNKSGFSHNRFVLSFK